MENTVYARIESTCKNCGEQILPGQSISKQTISRGDKVVTAWMHDGCPTRTSEQIREARAADREWDRENEAHRAYQQHQTAQASAAWQQEQLRIEAEVIRHAYEKEPERILGQLKSELHRAVYSHPRTMDSIGALVQAEREIEVARRRLSVVQTAEQVEAAVSEAWAA